MSAGSLKFRIIGVSAVVAAAIGMAGCGGHSTAQGGCWYTTTQRTGELAVHLPNCDGPEADIQRTVVVSPLNLIPGSEPANAREVCQVKVGANDGSAWIGIWADSAIPGALAAGQELCQLDATQAGAPVRWSNFH